MKCGTAAIKRHNMVLALLRSFDSLDRKATDQVGWISHKLSMPRIDAIKAINEARQYEKAAREAAEAGGGDSTTKPLLPTSAMNRPRMLPYATYEQRKRWECKCCGNIPNEDGEIEHGRGCYTQSEDGGGSSCIDPWPPTEESR